MERDANATNRPRVIFAPSIGQHAKEKAFRKVGNIGISVRASKICIVAKCENSDL